MSGSSVPAFVFMTNTSVSSVCVFGFMLLTFSVYLCSIASQAVREHRQQERHHLALS